jgi:hypothetical protein
MVLLLTLVTPETRAVMVLVAMEVTLILCLLFIFRQPKLYA